MAAATLHLRERVDSPLRITVLPSFASCWLLPRLSRFRELHPEIDLKLNSSPNLWNGSGDTFDVGIRSGLGRWPGLRADLITRETLAPVCSPLVAAGPPPLREPADLRGITLLHDTPKDGWSRWFEHAGVADINVTAGLTFDDAGLMLQAAADGQGVALGRLILASDHLAKGRLIRPFDLSIPNDYSYWLVYPRISSERPDIAAFRAWLLSEV